MPKKQSLKEPNEQELKAISELFDLGIQALNRWGGDDEFLMNMGSIVPEDIDEEGSEGRQQLLEILQKAELPAVTSEDMEIEADDLQAILPAIGLVLQHFQVPGLKQGIGKKFEKAKHATFAQVALDTPSNEIQQKTGDILKVLFKDDKKISAKISEVTVPVKSSTLKEIVVKKTNQPFASPLGTSQVIIISYCEGYDCIGWFTNKEHIQSVIDSQYFNNFYYSIDFQGEAEAVATSDASGAILLRKEFSQIKNKNEYTKNIPQEKVAEFVEWLSAEVVNKKHTYNGVEWNQYIEYFPEGLIGQAS